MNETETEIVIIATYTAKMKSSAELFFIRINKITEKYEDNIDEYDREYEIKGDPEISYSIENMYGELRGCFYSACMSGSVPIIEEMISHFGDHLFNVDNDDFEVICVSGHLRMAKFLIENLYITPEMLRIKNNNIFFITCAHEKFEVARWLIEVANITVDDIRAENCEQLRDLCHKKEDTAVQWLIDEFNLTPEDLGCLSDDSDEQSDDLDMSRFTFGAVDALFQTKSAAKLS
jgi:hypothetical protein